MLSLLLLLTLGRCVWGYTCTDGCEIGVDYVADGWCDCTDCGDETDYDCDTCLNGCPTECGGYTWCPLLALCPSNDCVINATYMNDGNCDCGNCEDEIDWTCGSCPYCPQTCGEVVVCVGGSTTPGPSTSPFTPFTTEDTRFYCDDGCGIADSYVEDGWCDCSECEDESAWTCASCPGCPVTCGAYIGCTGVTVPPSNGTQAPTVEPTTEAPQTTAGAYICEIDGCELDSSYVNDGYCDCIDCADEPLYTCESCPGCPETCGSYQQCTGEPATTEEPATTAPPLTTVSDYTCDDGCVIDASYVNDGYCDCFDCGEEPFYDCESCPGCPETCGSYEQCTGEPLTTAAPLACDDGCEISASFVEDGYCDCANCEDESAWTCESCGGCPETCGAFTTCTLLSTEAPVTTGDVPASTVAQTTDIETTAGTHTTAATQNTRDAAVSVRVLLPAVVSLLYALYSL